MIRAIKIGIYLMFAIILGTSETSVKFLYPVCLIIAFTEIIITLLKYFKRLCFVNFYANYILIAKERINKVFANEVENMEYRHDIIYIVKKDKKTVSIKAYSVVERMQFLTKAKEWVANNKITMSDESFHKLEEAIKN